MKKTLEEDTQSHEVVLADMRHKHSQEVTEINEELETLKKVCSCLWQVFLLKPAVRFALVGTIVDVS